MKTMILFLLINGLSMFMSCSSVLLPDDKLTMQREDYKGNELRTDGYYYRQDENYAHTTVRFLYKNGIILSARSYLTLDLSVVEKEMVSKYEKFGKEKPYWGLFKITNNRIECEQWVAPTERISICNSIGYIENDTTFCIMETFYSYNKKKYYINEVWRFKQFDNKPDSTNVYIK